MNSSQNASVVPESSSPAECLSDAQLLELIEEPKADSQQANLVAHLDGCDGCRARLETLAADDDHWTAVQCNLRQGNADQDMQSNRLTAAIAAFEIPTRANLIEEPPLHEAVEACGEIPEQIGPFRVELLVGQGGMGQVYKAYDPSLERFVAIKRINDSLLRQPGSLERFRREARSAAAIHDPHAVAIYAVEDSLPHPYLVMEFVEGFSLEERIRREGRLNWQEVARIGAEVAAGLAAAHEAGVIHRDVKPSNVLIEQQTTCAKISDFGLARSLDDSSLTQTGCVRGTPEYIAPEQANGDPIDHRADLFSLGCVLYAACVGQSPFHAANPLAVLRRVREDQPRPITEFRDDIPPALIQVVDRLLSKNADGRFASARELSEVLTRIQQGQPVHVERVLCPPRPRSTRRILLMLAASLLVMAGVGIAGSYTAGLLQTNGETDGSLAAAANATPRAGEKADKPGNNQLPQADTSNLPSAAGAVATDVPAPAARMQIVTPDDLMRERIQAEKDQLEVPQHPLLVREFPGHTGPVSSIALTPDGKLLVSCSGWPSGDRSARVWDIASGKELRQFDTSDMPKNPRTSGAREAPSELSTVAITPDGRHAVTGATGGAVCVWEIATGKQVRQFAKHTASVYDAAVSPRGDVVLTGGRDCVGRLWDLSTGEELMQLAGHGSWLRAVAISPCGRKALTSSYDKTMRLWDLERAEMIREFRPEQDWIWDVAFAPSGGIAACVIGPLVQLWDLESGELIRSLTRRDVGNGTSVDVSPDGRLAVSGSYDGKVRLWSVDTGELLETYFGHRDWVWTVKFLPDGRHVASAGGGRYTATGGTEPGIDFSIRLWKLPAIGPRVVKPN